MRAQEPWNILIYVTLYRIRRWGFCVDKCSRSYSKKFNFNNNYYTVMIGKLQTERVLWHISFSHRYQWQIYHSVKQVANYYTVKPKSIISAHLHLNNRITSSGSYHLPVQFRKKNWIEFKFRFLYCLTDDRAAISKNFFWKPLFFFKRRQRIDFWPEITRRPKHLEGLTDD